MSYLVLILAMKMGNMAPTTVTLKLDVDAQDCEEVFIPDAKKKYATSPLTVISAKCFPTN